MATDDRDEIDDDRYIASLETEEEIDWLRATRDENTDQEESESDDSDESKDSEQA